MPLRRLLLRIMLWSLGLAALTSVGAILLSQGALPWRVTGTGLATATACGLLILMSMLIDRAPTRFAGMLGMFAVILEFSGALLLIWDALQLFGSGFEERMAFTMALGVPAALLGMGSVVLLGGRRTRESGGVALASCAAAFAVAVTGVWSANVWSANWRPGATEDLFATALAVLTGGVLVSASLVEIHRPLPRRWPWLGVGLAVLGSSLWLVQIWGSETDRGVAWCSGLMAAAVAVAHANLVRLCPLSRPQLWVRWATVAAVAATAGLIELLVIEGRLYPLTGGTLEILGRLTGASGILAACGTLALLVLARLNRSVDYEAGALADFRVVLVCPRCARKQDLAPGGDRCRACGLRIHVVVEEPRCPKCQYLLYQLTSPICPECGTAIDQA